MTMFARAGSDGPPGNDAERASTSARDEPAGGREQGSSGATRSDPGEEALVAGIRNGDEKAFANAFRAHVTPLIRYARRFLPTEAAAQDIVMDVFARLWRDRAAIPSDLRLGAYLNVAVRNAALNAAAHLRVELSWRQSGAAEGWSPAMSAPILEPDEELDRSEAKEELRRAYLALPDRLRQVIALRWFEGRSYQDIARELQLSPKSVDNYLAKAMRLLREALTRRRDG